MNTPCFESRTLKALIIAAYLATADAVPAENSKSSRPGTGGEADEVTVYLGLLDIVGVDNRAEVFSADFFIQVEWHDPRLAATDSEASELRKFAATEIWTPALTALNDRGLDLVLPQMATVDRDGNVTLRQRVSGPLAVELDLREFPFDEQRLPIEIVSYEHSPDELVFSTDSMMLVNPQELSSGGWTFRPIEPEFSVYRLRQNGTGSSMLTFAVIAEREAGYYLINLVLPMTLILFLAWMVHWLPPELIPARMGMASATVFSLIALGVSFRLTLPEIDYLTAADRFVLYSTLLVLVSLAATVMSVRLVNAERPDSAVRLTRYARIAFPVLYAAIIVKFAT